VNGVDFFYTVPNHYVRAIKNEMAHNATPSGQLCSVAPGWSFWADESMVDELAHATTNDYRIIALDAKTGIPCGDFGNNGEIKIMPLRVLLTIERHASGMRPLKNDSSVRFRALGISGPGWFGMAAPIVFAWCQMSLLTGPRSPFRERRPMAPDQLA
jgi:hypothetical protein